MESSQLEPLLKLNPTVLSHLIEAANCGRSMIIVAVPKSDDQSNVTVHTCTQMFPNHLFELAKPLINSQFDKLIAAHESSLKEPVAGAGGLRIGEAMKPPRE